MRKLSFKWGLWATAVLTLAVSACDTTPKNPNFQADAADAAFIHDAMQGLTHVIKHDNFPPMIASRIYAYAHIAAYEALNGNTPQYRSLVGQIKTLPTLPKPEQGQEYCLPLASIQAYIKVGKALTFSLDSMEKVEKSLMTRFEAIGIPKEVFKRSLAYGDTLAGAVLKWAVGDAYNPTRSMPKYTVIQQDPSRWRPTAPGYDDALEPHWNKIRPMIMDSAAQFKPVPPTPFDSSKTSKFYKEAYEVYQSVADSTPERIATGWYWDDNPVALNNAGHVNFITKKVSPGGHWLWITMYTAKAQKASIFAATEAYLKVAVGLFDGFISCWDEKYRSNVIRPESYIGKYIAPDWTPIIVTPPFPEYTSGHSCVSGASSVILADIFGDNTPFTDSTEVQFGLPARTFASFREAAEQAAISRFYAGIHYMPAIREGLVQGRNVGKNVVEKLKTRS